MIVLFVLPLLFVLAAVLWAAAGVLFAIYSTWQVSHDLAALRIRAAPRTAAAAPRHAAAVPARALRPSLFATSPALPYLATALAIAMWTIFLLVVQSRG